MRLWNKIKQAFTWSNLLWCGATLLLAGIFLVLGLTAPSLKGFENKETMKVVYQEEASESAPESAPESLSSPESVVSESSGKIPLNSATKEQLMTVPGIGEVYAERIINYRNEIGGYTDMEQLKNVKGIGEARYKSWAPYFSLD